MFTSDSADTDSGQAVRFAQGSQSARHRPPGSQEIVSNDKDVWERGQSLPPHARVRVPRGTGQVRTQDIAHVFMRRRPLFADAMRRSTVATLYWKALI